MVATNTKSFKPALAPNFRWPADLAWRITLRIFDLNNSQISRASGVSQARLSQFLNSKTKLTHENFVDAIAALPEDAKAFYLERVFGQNTTASTCNESPAMTLADLILYYMTRNGLSIKEFAQQVMLPIDVIEEIFAGSFERGKSDREIKAVARMMSPFLINPSTGEKFLDSMEILVYCGLMSGDDEDENGSTHPEQSHCNNN